MYFPLRFFRVLVILFSCYSSIWPFCLVLSIPKFNSKIVLRSLHPVFGMSRYLLNLPTFANTFWFISLIFLLQLILSSLCLFVDPLLPRNIKSFLDSTANNLKTFSNQQHCSAISTKLQANFKFFRFSPCPFFSRQF